MQASKKVNIVRCSFSVEALLNRTKLLRKLLLTEMVIQYVGAPNAPPNSLLRIGYIFLKCREYARLKELSHTYVHLGTEDLSTKVLSAFDNKT